MAKIVRPNEPTETEATRLYQRADEHWSGGRVRSAFRLFLAAANAGEIKAFRIVGQFYDGGEGVRANEEAALYWYRKAFRHGSYAAANNIGCIWRDRGKLSRAIWWFERAIKSGDDDANLNIAKIYLRGDRTLVKAIHYLKKTERSSQATEGSKEEARSLLKRIKSHTR